MNESLSRRISNRVLHLLARVLPGATGLRPFLHRLRGVKIGSDVFIGDDVYLENEHPKAVEIQDHVHIGVRAIILAHTRGSGRVVLEKDSFVGPNAIIVTSGDRTLRVGEGAVVGAGVVVTCDIPAHVFVGSAAATSVAGASVPFTKAERMEDFLRGLTPLEEAQNHNYPKQRPTIRPHGAPVSTEPVKGIVQREQIREAVLRAIAQTKELSLDENGLTDEESTVLVGQEAALDSMSFVNFVVALEEEITRITHYPLDVVQMLHSQGSQGAAFSTVRDLIDFLCHTLQQGPLF